MNNRQKETPITEIGLAEFFQKHGSPRQRHYEAIRPIAIEGEAKRQLKLLQNDRQICQNNLDRLIGVLF